MLIVKYMLEINLTTTIVIILNVVMPKQAITMALTHVALR